MTGTGSIAKDINESVLNDLKENSIHSNTHGKSIDTGKAAVLAYTNLEQSTFDHDVSQVQTDWRKSQNTRNSGATNNKSGEFPTE